MELFIFLAGGALLSSYLYWTSRRYKRTSVRYCDSCRKNSPRSDWKAFEEWVEVESKSWWRETETKTSWLIELTRECPLCHDITTWRFTTGALF